MKIKFEFSKDKARREIEEEVAEAFLGWLSNSGEQAYWDAILECSDDEHVIRHFDYSKKLEVGCEVVSREEWDDDKFQKDT